MTDPIQTSYEPSVGHTEPEPVATMATHRLIGSQLLPGVGKDRTRTEVQSLLSCNVSEVMAASSRTWCWTIPHLQEQINHYHDRFAQGLERGSARIVLHQHHHGEPCNSRCVLMRRVADADG